MHTYTYTYLVIAVRVCHVYVYVYVHLNWRVWVSLSLEWQIWKKCLPHSLGLDSTISHNWINVANFTKDHVPSPLWMEMSKVADLLLSCALIVSREGGCSPPKPFTSANISLFGPESCFLTFCHPVFFSHGRFYCRR